MNLTLENDVLQEALRVIARIAPPVSGNITVDSDGSKLFFRSNSDTSRCSVNLPADVKGKAGNFAVSLSSLRDATKGRKTLEVSYEKTMCRIKSGAYKADLATVDSMELEDSEDEKIGKPVKLSGEQVQWLKSAVATVALKPTQLIATFMPVAIKLTKKGAFVACYDSNHMAFINSGEVTGELETKLPLDILTSVLDAFGKQGFKMQLSKASLYVSNPLVKVVLSLPQEEENELQIDEVIAGAKGSKEAKGHEVEVSKTDLLAFLDNARAIATKERSEIKMELGEGKIRLEVQTANGSSKAVIKASAAKKDSVLVDFEFLDEAVRKCPESVIMKVVKGEFLAIKLKTATVIVSQNQEQGA